MAKKNRPFEAVVDRVQIALGVTTDAGIAKALDYSRQTITGWRERGIPEKSVFARLGHVRPDWIMTGHGPMLKGDAGEEERLATLEKIGRLLQELHAELHRFEDMRS